MRGELPTLDLSLWPGAHAYYLRDVTAITGITLHYTAGSKDATPTDIARYQTSAAAAAQTGAGYPFPGIAYTFYVDGAGRVYRCWDFEVRCWHSGAVVDGIARNASHIGICYAGDYEPNERQIAGMAAAITWCQRYFGRSLTVEGHKDAPYSTLCPGLNWPKWKSLVTALIG